MIRILFLGFGLLTGLIGCAPSAHEIVQKWKDKGWKVEKIHGMQGPIERHGTLRSEHAKAIEASWIENGVRKTKIYYQLDNKILVLRFFRKDGDQFAVVMKKRT